MILKFNKFLGKIRNALNKDEVIDLVSLITEMRPNLQKEFDNSNISKLIDNINYYDSDDKNYRISVYFRESDIYKNKDGSVTRGNFKTLFKINISKIEGDIKIGNLKDFIVTFYDVITSFYKNSVFRVKIDGERMEIDDFKLLNDNDVIKDVKLIIRILD